jgi:protein PhnA
MDSLYSRSGGQCELCGSRTNLAPQPVDPETTGTPETSVLLCETCHEHVASGKTLEGAHWFCLQDSIWSEVAPVQVLTYRLLHRLTGQTWATDTLEQAYLDEENLRWAERALAPESEEAVAPVDSNGTRLQEGDSVTLIKDLDVKGANFTAKRGTLVKNVHVGDDPTHVEGKVNKVSIMLKTCFLKRVSP